MNATDWLVITGGVAVIVWVNWYFFLAQRSAVAAIGTASSGYGTSGTIGSGRTLEATIVVKGGYDPAVIRVKAGEPVRLVFDRQETSGCSEEIVFPDFGIKKFLPAFQKTTVEVTPPRPGKYGFTCGMSMLHGSLTAE
ncbi:MAG: cupredoxin domain-containing protein [Gemmatimonadaceae bacterium]